MPTCAFSLADESIMSWFRDGHKKTLYKSTHSVVMRKKMELMERLQKEDIRECEDPVDDNIIGRSGVPYTLTYG